MTGEPELLRPGFESAEPVLLIGPLTYAKSKRYSGQRTERGRLMPSFFTD